MEKYRYVILAALLVVLLLLYPSNTTQASEPNWPQFRGPRGLGIAPDNKTYGTSLPLRVSWGLFSEIAP